MVTIQSQSGCRLLTLILLCLCSLASAAAPEPFEDGERVLFLGDSITRSGGWHSQISLFYETRFPTRRITWLNAGISGDTAGGALQRLQWDVLDREPDRVVIVFGMNDVARPDLPGEIGSEARVEQYQTDMLALIKALRQADIKIILCTPSPYESTAQLKREADPRINSALTRCADICRELATEHDLPLVDFNGPMNSITADYHKNNPEFTLIGEDRVHPRTLGNTVMAHLFLQAQDVSGVISNTVIDAAAGRPVTTENAKLTDFGIEDDGAIEFNLLEKALPMPLGSRMRQALRLTPGNALLDTLENLESPRDAYTFPGWDRMPMQDALHKQSLTVTGLPEDQYKLIIDDQAVGRFRHDDLADGINLAAIETTPQYQQAQEVSAIHAKRHRTASLAPRMTAFTRLFTLAPAGIDIDHEDEVRAALQKLINDPDAKGRAELGCGGYAQAMAEKYLETQPKAAKITDAIAAADDEIYRHNQPATHRYRLQPVQHPLSKDDRRAVFEARHTPEEVEKTAREFLDLLLLDHAGLVRTNLRRRPLLQKTADLAQADKPIAALDTFRDYIFHKLRKPSVYGLPDPLLDPYRGLIKPGAMDKTLARADQLMQGQVVQDAPPMPPGTVWLPRTKPGPTGTGNPWSPGRFQPLAAAYLLTGRQDYLDKWIEYMDGWAMFENTDDAIPATDISDRDNKGIQHIFNVYKTLAGIARLQPAAEQNFPADSLARILRKLIRVYMPLSLVYHDSNPQNWTPGATTAQMQVAALMDEFKAAEHLFRRARHRHENYGVIQFLPDGGETEHALWYNCHYYDGATTALDLVDRRRSVNQWHRPSWETPVYDPAWEHEQRRKLIDRARYFLQMLTPQRQYPIGNRSDQRTLPDWKSAAMVEHAILNGAPDLQVLLNTLRGNTASGLPDFTMSAFPYSGSWIMRTGWDKTAGYAHFFCSPYPTGGHAMRGLKSNNGFWLSHNGQDLLTAGGFGAYSYDRSPLRVDGKEQFAQAGIGNPGFNKNHKGFGVAYIDPPPPDWRSHSSANFDFAEGVYDGAYGDFVDDHHDTKDYRPAFLAGRAREIITGVSHKRQVFFVKDPALWIVVDQLQSRASHEYTLDWRLPTAPIRQFEGKRHAKYNGKTFSPNNIEVEETSQTIATSAADMPNLNIQHFGPELNFSTKREDGERIKDDYTIHYKMYDFWRVSGSWQSRGNDVLVSLIEVIPQGENSRIAETQETGNGFEATLTGGRQLTLASSTDGRTVLALGDRRLVIDEESYEQDGNRSIPIHRPIAPVQIEPARTIITGPTPITLTSTTPDVEIRYTLDGSEPTVHSPLYTEPFTVDNSVTVKARAFRPGLEQNPTRLAGTHATVTRTARFEKAKPLDPAAPLNDKRFQPGLTARYYEGDWKDLVFFPETVDSVKTVNVRHLFDRCRPNAGSVFGWTYSGFLAIPEDGVYTFHAPEEMITSRQEPGYSLRLFAGREMLPNNRPSGRLNEWYPATTRHAYGAWSVALEKGIHPFKVAYVDYRGDAVERLNHPGMKLNTIWNGAKPELLVSGPDWSEQPIPKAWFKRR